MAQGGEVKFPFRLDRERAYAARGAQARPPAVPAKYNDPDNRANQWPYGGHKKAGAPKLPAKSGQGLIFASSNEDDSEGNDILHRSATKLAVRQALAATKDGHRIRTVRADEDDPDDDESASAVARYQHGFEPWRLQPSSKAGSARPLARPRGGTATRSQAEVRTAQTATTVRPWAPKNRCCSESWQPLPSGARLARGTEMAAWGFTRMMASRQQQRSAPGAKGRMPNDGSKAALEGITGAKVMRGVLAALHDNINKEAEQDNDNEEEQMAT
jgi:hypothetical protein